MGREVGRRFKGEGTWGYLCLIPVDVWQKPTQYCKAINLQLKINKFSKIKKIILQFFFKSYEKERGYYLFLP